MMDMVHAVVAIHHGTYSGNTVLFIGMLTFITEVIIFVQLVLLK